MLILLAVINIPISLFLKYVKSGYNSSIILSFGSICWLELNIRIEK